MHRFKGLWDCLGSFFWKFWFALDIHNAAWKYQVLSGMMTLLKSLNSPKSLWGYRSVYFAVNHEFYKTKNSSPFLFFHLPFSLALWKIISVLRKHLYLICDFQSPFRICILIWLYSYMNPSRLDYPHFCRWEEMAYPGLHIPRVLELGFT